MSVLIHFLNRSRRMPVVLAGWFDGDMVARSESKVRDDPGDFVDGLIVKYTACSLRRDTEDRGPS